GHGLAGDVDVQAFDIALELRRDGIDVTFIGLDPPGRPHGLAERAQRGDFGPHTQLLDLFGADADLVRTRLFVRPLVFALVDRDIVHAHRVFLWRGGRVGQAHGVAVVEQLARLDRTGDRACGRCGTGHSRVAGRRMRAAAQPVPARSDATHDEERHNDG